MTMMMMTQEILGMDGSQMDRWMDGWMDGQMIPLRESFSFLFFLFASDRLVEPSFHSSHGYFMIEKGGWMRMEEFTTLDASLPFAFLVVKFQLVRGSMLYNWSGLV